MHFLYKTTNKINGKYYIGTHTTNNIDDGYLGSSKTLQKDIKKIGKDYFVREILSYHESHKKALLAERKIVDRDFVNDSETYNCHAGGSGGWSDVNAGNMCSVKDKEGNYLRVPTTDPRIKSGELVGVTKGNKLSAEHKAEISKNSLGHKKSDAMKKKLSSLSKTRIWLTKDSKRGHCQPDQLQERLDDGWKKR